MSIQDNSKDSIDAIIANTSIHDCDDSTYEVHVSAATLHLLSQLRDNLTKGLNIYSLIEATMLKYAESHATKDFMLVKSSQAYKQLNENTTKELEELRQLCEVLKKENEELRNELNALRDKDNGYVLKEAPNVEHSSEHTVTLSDEDVTSIKGKGFDTTVSFTRGDSDDVRFVDIKESLKNHVHPNPNGVGNGVYVSTGKPENNTVEKIHVTKYSEIEETKI
nr:MAG TPA: hypothetical protein [Caudoviricetes sp.]